MATPLPPTLEKPAPLLFTQDRADAPNIQQLKGMLERGTLPEQIEALKRTIRLFAAGESPVQLIFPVITNIMPKRDHTLKKLQMLFFEVCDKKTPDGKLLPEMILACNHFRNDLISPNEYVRGSALRYLCKLHEAELLEPLVPSIKANLEHRHAYVRRNAVMAVYTVYKQHEHLMPEAPEVILKFLNNESDASCKRNAFLMLYQCAADRAVEYLSGVLEQVNALGEMMQMTVVDLIRKLCRTNTAERARYLKAVFSLLSASSPAVQFEAAAALLSLSGSPAAVKAATASYISLLCNNSDNNVKLIVLDRLAEIKRSHPKVLQELMMDVLRALASPSMDIRRKTLAMVLDMVTQQNVGEVVLLLKKEIAKTQTKEFEKAAEYRQLLIQSIHGCTVRFPEIAGDVVHVLMDFLGDQNVGSAVDVMTFLREVIETYPELREAILRKLISTLYTIRSSKVCRAALWIIGEYSVTKEDVDLAITAIKETLGEPPFIDESGGSTASGTSGAAGGAPGSTPGAGAGAGAGASAGAGAGAGSTAAPKPNRLLLPDGTYATQSAYVVEPGAGAAAKTAPPGTQQAPLLRAMMVAGDFFLAASLAATLTKLVLKAIGKGVSNTLQNRLRAEAMYTLTAILRLGKSAFVAQPIDPDSAERIVQCIRVLAEPTDLAVRSFVHDCRQSFTQMLAEQKGAAAAAAASGGGGGGGGGGSGGGGQPQNPHTTTNNNNLNSSDVTQPDELIRVRQLRTRRPHEGALPVNNNSESEDEELEGADEVDLFKAVGALEGQRESAANKLSRMYQLTGFSDPVYAEALVTVHQYDILLDVTVINRTADILQNVALELTTLGDLKLCERPQTYTIGPHEKRLIKANIKMSSTETGIIFGNIVYDVAGVASVGDRNIVVLNDIHIDIMDYIAPAPCPDTAFRKMWEEFEWENKVVVRTNISDLNEFLLHILKSTNMGCLTPQSSLAGESGFLAANLYAKSIFGEDALANLSVEKSGAEGKINGYIRIRSKTQGMALALGEKITQKQRGPQ